MEQMLELLEQLLGPSSPTCSTHCCKSHCVPSSQVAFGKRRLCYWVSVPQGLTNSNFTSCLCPDHAVLTGSPLGTAALQAAHLPHVQPHVACCSLPTADADCLEPSAQVARLQILPGPQAPRLLLLKGAGSLLVCAHPRPLTCRPAASPGRTTPRVEASRLRCTQMKPLPAAPEETSTTAVQPAATAAASKGSLG